MNMLEHFLQCRLEALDLVAHVVLADEMAFVLEGVGCKLQGGVAEVHGAGVVSKRVAAHVHQPAVLVTNCLGPEAGGLGPGF